MTPRQNNSKANLLCVLLIVTRLPRKSETDERERDTERERKRERERERALRYLSCNPLQSRRIADNSP